VVARWTVIARTNSSVARAALLNDFLQTLRPYKTLRFNSRCFPLLGSKFSRYVVHIVNRNSASQRDAALHHLFLERLHALIEFCSGRAHVTNRIHRPQRGAMWVATSERERPSATVKLNLETSSHLAPLYDLYPGEKLIRVNPCLPVGRRANPCQKKCRRPCAPERSGGARRSFNILIHFPDDVNN
jgi:hypothetical protein